MEPQTIHVLWWLFCYQVIAYSKNEHEASAPVIVNTRKLGEILLHEAVNKVGDWWFIYLFIYYFLPDTAFLLAHNLTASHVTTTSALFQWKHNPKNNVHDLDFKVTYSAFHCMYVTKFQYPSLLLDTVEMFRNSTIHKGWRSNGREVPFWAQDSFHFAFLSELLHQRPCTQHPLHLLHCLCCRSHAEHTKHTGSVHHTSWK